MCFPTSIVGEEIRCYPLPPLICCALVKPSSMHAEYNELHSNIIPLLLDQWTMVQWAGCSQSDSSSPQNLLNVVDCSNPRISRSSRIRKETVDPELPMKYLKMLPILKLQYIKTPDQLQFYFKYNNSATLTLWILLSDRLSNAKKYPRDDT